MAFRKSTTLIGALLTAVGLVLALGLAPALGQETAYFQTFTLEADCNEPRGNLHLNAGPVVNGGVEYTQLYVNGQLVTEGESNKPDNHFWDYDPAGENTVSIVFTMTPEWPRPDTVPNPLPNLPAGSWTEYPTNGVTVTYTFVPTDPGCTVVPSETATTTVVPSETATTTVVPSETATTTVVPSETATATDVPSETASATATVLPSETVTATASQTVVPTNGAADGATVNPTTEPTAVSTIMALPSTGSGGPQGSIVLLISGMVSAGILVMTIGLRQRKM